MIGTLVLAVLISSVVGIYPLHRHVLFDPHSYDLLYNSSTGIISESWYFTTPMTLTSFVLPSRVMECGSDDLYDEDVTVTVTRVVSSVNVPVASGRFARKQAYGQEINLSLYNSTSGDYPRVSSNVYYHVNISLPIGLYPWHLSRPFSSFTGFHSYSNAAGYIIGVEYSR